MGKRTASAETLKPDPVYGSKLVSKFVNCLMYGGKKSTAQRVFYHAMEQIKTLLDTRVRPAVAQDGGDITFHGFDRGVVYLHMQGACAGCPSSTLTLKMGIENLLRHYIPEVTEVRPVAA